MTSTNKPKIYADFNNADEKGRIRLNSEGSLTDLGGLKLKLESGLEILLDDDEGLMISGVINFSREENIWVAIIDWDKLK